MTRSMRWLRWRLSTLLWLTLVVSAFCGGRWASPEIDQWAAEGVVWKRLRTLEPLEIITPVPGEDLAISADGVYIEMGGRLVRCVPLPYEGDLLGNHVTNLTVSGFKPPHVALLITGRNNEVRDTTMIGGGFGPVDLVEESEEAGDPPRRATGNRQE